jgi:hypothetical protein
MDTIELIHTIDGIEIPRPGRWPIAPGQQLAVTVGRQPRRRRTMATVTGGALVVGADGLAVSLELTLAGVDPATALEAVYVGGLGRAEASGRWWFEGRLEWTRGLARVAGAVRSGPSRPSVPAGANGAGPPHPLGVGRGRPQRRVAWSAGASSVRFGLHLRLARPPAGSTPQV